MSSEKRTGNHSDVPTIDGIPVRTPLGEFDAAEMLECASCHRKTPPNRLDCIYCGDRLVLDDDQKASLQPVIRPPAEDSSGFNLIYFASAQKLTEEQVVILQNMTRLGEAEIEMLTGPESAVPLARGESREAVDLAAERMREAGLDVSVYADKEFAVDSKPLRMRGMSVDDVGNLALILFNNDEVIRLSPDDLELIVVGIFIQNKIEANEKHKRKGPAKVMNTTEVSADEILIDVYARSRQGAFRIQPTGFDFSFLGAKKALIASDNLKLALQFLREFSPNSHFDESYPSIRSAIDSVWPVAERQDNKSVKRKGFGSFEKTRVTTSSNLEQFGQYSALQRKAMLRLKAGEA